MRKTPRSWRPYGALGLASLAALALAHCNALVATPDGHLRAAATTEDAGLVCAEGTKTCGDQCVSIAEPGNGCDTSSCAPCNVNAQAHCGPGGCILDRCEPGFVDCNNDPSDGCESSPTSFLTDPKNCGACGHACRDKAGTGPGMCRNGECESFVLAQHQTYATTVVPDEDPDGYVYFTNTTFDVDGRVARVRKRGDGAVDVLYHADRFATNSQGYLIDRPAGLVLDGDRVYWGTTNGNDGPYGRVHWAKRDGSEHGSIGSWNGPSTLLVDHGMLYWTNRWDPQLLLRIPTSQLGAGPDGGAGTTPTVMRTAQDELSDALGLRADFVSFGSLYYCTLKGLYRVDKNTFATATMTSTPCYALALDSTFVYFGRDSIIYRLDLLNPGKIPERLADLKLGKDDSDHFTSVAQFDGHYLYVEHFDRQDSRIYRMSTDGADILRLASKVQMGAGVSVDEQAVYWSSQATGEIRKIWK